MRNARYSADSDIGMRLSHQVAGKVNPIDVASVAVAGVLQQPDRSVL